MMDRRAFLASLAALGAAALTSFRAAEASDLQVEQAWTRAQEEPYWFEVDERTICAPGDRYVWPATRREVYGVAEERLRSPDDIVAEVRDCAPLETHFSQLAADRRDEIEDMLRSDLPASERRRLRKLLKALRDDEQTG